ncbi:MAG: hypothetical protein POELPBGB_01427 [Bacteroidia bacterium]|nr:hypothetical protein [Bacteroidia bacterium]
MKDKLGDLQRLKHIHGCISDLEEILHRVDADSFYRSSEKKYATERILEIIGEAVNKISPMTLALSEQSIPWRDIVDFRNLVSHEYFRVDYTMVYKIATQEIPTLKKVVALLITKLEV